MGPRSTCVCGRFSQRELGLQRLHIHGGNDRDEGGDDQPGQGVDAERVKRHLPMVRELGDAVLGVRGGTSAGALDLYSVNAGTRVSVLRINSLPTNGSTVYVRLWTLASGIWVFNDYTYTATTTKAVMTSPANGSTLSGSSVTFQ